MLHHVPGDRKPHIGPAPDPASPLPATLVTAVSAGIAFTLARGGNVGRGRPAPPSRIEKLNAIIGDDHIESARKPLARHHRTGTSELRLVCPPPPLLTRLATPVRCSCGVRLQLLLVASSRA